MQARNTKFLTFLLHLIDIQIKKYSAWARVGDEAEMEASAVLIVDQVEDLVASAQELLSLAIEGEPYNQALLRAISKTKFYLELEDLRMTAGELLDVHNINYTTYDRLQLQLQELERFTKAEGLNPIPFVATTQAQRQYAHDSHAIADLFLTFALRLSQNRYTPLPVGIPERARRQIKEKAFKGHYKQREFQGELQKGQRHCQEFLKESKLEKGTMSLDNKQAVSRSLALQKQLSKLLANFDRRVQPWQQSKRFSWYALGGLLRRRDKSQKPPMPRFKFAEPQSTRCKCSSTFFKAAAAVLATTALAVGFACRL